MKHTILIMFHKNMEHLIHIISSFSGKDDFSIYIHVDKKYRMTTAEIARIRGFRAVRGVFSEYHINWGGFNLLKAELLLMREAVRDDHAGYVHLISGQDFPVKKHVDFLNYFEANKGREFLEYRVYPNPEWENGTRSRIEHFFPFDWFNCKTASGLGAINRIINLQKRLKIRRKPPGQFSQMYGGSTWFSLSRECVRYILEETAGRPAFYNRLKYTFVPEELYIPTVVLNSPFGGAVVNDNLRYIIWQNRNGNYPANLDAGDFQRIINSKAFFARKMEYPVSRSLVEMLGNHIV